MFERFTDRARRIVVLSGEEARLTGDNFIGTEHLLLGLIHEGEGVAAKALARLGITDLEKARAVIEALAQRDPSRVAPAGHIPFTPRAKKVLELSLRESLQLGHNYIGTEHVLLGLLREGDGVGARVLAVMSPTQHDALQKAREAVMDLLAGYTTPSTQRPAVKPQQLDISLDAGYAKEVVDVLEGLHISLFRSTWGTHPLSALQQRLEEGLVQLAVEAATPKAG